MTYVWWQWLLPAAIQATPLLLLAAGLDLLLPQLLAPRWRAMLWLMAAAKLLVPVRVAADWALLPAPVYTLSPLWLSLLPAMWMTGLVVLAAGSGWWLRKQRRALEPGPASAALAELFEQAARQVGVTGARIVESCHLDGPATLGRTVYWPVGLERVLGVEEQLQVLRHELAHIRRYDLWRDLGWTVLVVVFWFHPLVWWAARRMRAIREQCCDETAARLPGHAAESYRSALLRVVQRMERPVPGLALVDPRAPLLHRLALLEGERRAHIRGLGALVAIAIVWPLATWANQASQTVAEWIVRPPGSLQLRYMVLERLAQEGQK